MSLRTVPPFRADHVGSFLRPRELLAARERFQRGEIGSAELRAVEDEAIRRVVRLQEDAGLRGITDGELRRTYFHVDFLEKLAGVETRGGLPAHFRTAAGQDIDFAPPVLAVTGPVRHRGPIQVADFEFLRAATKRTPKVSIPSPTMVHFRGGRAAIEEVIGAARGLADMIWSREVEGGNFATPERRAALEARIGELSNGIRDEVVRRYYRQDFSERLQRTFAPETPRGAYSGRAYTRSGNFEFGIAPSSAKVKV